MRIKYQLRTSLLFSHRTFEITYKSSLAFSNIPSGLWFSMLASSVFGITMKSALKYTSTNLYSILCSLPPSVPFLLPLYLSLLHPLCNISNPECVMMMSPILRSSELNFNPLLPPFLFNYPPSTNLSAKTPFTNHFHHPLFLTFFFLVA